MEGRASRGRGGWRRGGRGGGDGDSSGGEQRGRGRGGQHRGRGKRDHHRGRGRGGGERVTEYHHRDRDEGDDFPEDDVVQVFSRRKLESNWERYAESERQEPADDTPTQRGTDFQALLGSAGDSFTQFRFAEEKDWEVDSFAASQMTAFVDLPALAETLQQLPLHQRLHLEAELLQVSTPTELPPLPPLPLAPKPEPPRTVTFSPPSAALKSLDVKSLPGSNPPSNSDSGVCSSADTPLDDSDVQLDELLRLEKPASGGQTVAIETPAPEREREDVKDVAEETTTTTTTEEVENKHAAPPEAPPTKQEMTEEDLEDWLDSMIS